MTRRTSETARHSLAVTPCKTPCFLSQTNPCRNREEPCREVCTRSVPAPCAPPKLSQPSIIPVILSISQESSCFTPLTPHRPHRPRARAVGAWFPGENQVASWVAWSCKGNVRLGSTTLSTILNRSLFLSIFQGIFSSDLKSTAIPLSKLQLDECVSRIPNIGSCFFGECWGSSAVQCLPVQPVNLYFSRGIARYCTS